MTQVQLCRYPQNSPLHCQTLKTSRVNRDPHTSRKAQRSRKTNAGKAICLHVFQHAYRLDLQKTTRTRKTTKEAEVSSHAPNPYAPHWTQTTKHTYQDIPWSPLSGGTVGQVPTLSPDEGQAAIYASNRESHLAVRWLRGSTHSENTCGMQML
jgi:hypothetical protein